MVSIKAAINKYKIGLIILSGLILVVVLFIFYFKYLEKNSNYSTGFIEINQKIINIEIASSPINQYFGLSKRKSLCADCGMLFIFTDKQIREFVMRNMEFPLDIIFIADGRIINIAENLEPEGNNPINKYKSIAPADKVLELNGGYCQKHGIEVGDSVIFND